MKKIVSVLLLLSAIGIAVAQNPAAKIVLNKNQQLKLTTTIKGSISQEMMGQSMETTMDITESKAITVKEASSDNYQLEAVTTHKAMNLSMMGQEKKFDSNSKDDMSGEMKDAGKDVNVVKKFNLSSDGKCKAQDTAAKSEESQNGDMMQQMFGGGMDAGTTASHFMLIPNGKKAGDSWTDSTGDGKTKTLWNYTWESTAGNIAIIKATAKSTTSNTINTQGMDITINATTDITETRKLDLATGILLNKVSVSKLNGTAEVMGQSIPMSGTNTTTVTAE